MSEISFAEAMCIFIADCMVVVSKCLDKETSIKEMAAMANQTFKNFLSTKEAVAEVKEVILSFA